MKLAVWEKDYDWSYETGELREKLALFVSRLAQAKRLTYDPFRNENVIRCTFDRCRMRYNINGAALKDIEKLSIGDIFRRFAGLHSHFIDEAIGTSPNSLPAGTNSLRRILFKNMKNLVYCTDCSKLAPFPIANNLAWTHPCPNFILDLRKANNAVFKTQAWVIQLNFELGLWRWMLHSGLTYDEDAVAWLAPDDDTVMKILQAKASAVFPTFRMLPKPKPRPNAVAISGRATAANEILNCIPAPILKKVYRLLCIEMHPDKGGDTTAFQTLQQAWNKWETSK